MSDRRDRIADDRSGKSPEAYRTIGEVADLLGVAPHVLRFWESRFSQIRPVKRAGNRRYYRPDDIALIERIRSLLHDEGYSIRGVQKLFRETGVKEMREAPEGAAPAPDADGNRVAAEEDELRGILTELTEIRELLR